MALLALVTAGKVHVVDGVEVIQSTKPAGEAIAAGQLVRLDVSTGKFTKANGTSATEGRAYGVAIRTVAAGEPVTAVRRGLLDGFNLDSQAYDKAIFASDTDGTLGDAAGTVSVSVGRVDSVFATTLGTAPDKVLSVELV
jgi:hypothetical protein